MGRQPAAYARYLVPTSIVALALALRAWQLGEESLWIDESASLYYVREYGFLTVWSDVLGNEPHPPLYYSLLDAWTSVAGTSPAALRTPSVVFGAAAVGFTYLLATRLADRPTALVASLLMALSAFHVHAARQARMYTMLTAASTLSVWLFLRALDRPDRARMTAWAGSALLLGYVHAYGLFVLVAQLVAFGALRWPSVESGEAEGWLRAWGFVVLGLVPWILAVVYGMQTGSAGDRIAWIAPPGGLSLARLPAVLLGLDRIVGAWELIAASLVLAVGLAWGWRSLAREAGTGLGKGGAAGLLGVWVVAGLVGPFVVSHLFLPVFLERYALAASPAVFVVLGRSVTSFGAPLAALLALGLVGAPAYALPTTYGGNLHQPWDEVGQLVGSRAETGDVVLVGEHRPGFVETRTSFTYYFDREDVPVEGIRLGISEGDLEELLSGRDTVWLVLSPHHPKAGGVEWGKQRLDGLLEEEGYGSAQTWRRMNIEVHRYEPGAGSNTTGPA